MDDPTEPDDRSARHVWSAGRYPAMAPNMLPAIARLVNTAGIDPGNRVLDVGCGTGNAALTARRAGANVVGLDLAHGMLELARDNASLAAEADIGWLTGDAEALPSRTTRSTWSSRTSVTSSRRTRPAPARNSDVTKPGGRVCFTAWSPNGVVGDLTEVLTDHVAEAPSDPWSHLQWGACFRPRPVCRRHRLLVPAPTARVPIRHATPLLAGVRRGVRPAFARPPAHERRRRARRAPPGRGRRARGLVR